MPTVDVAPACSDPIIWSHGRGTCVLELRPHRSLTPAGARRFMLSVAIGAFAVAGFFTAHGFWPVLVFAMLEVFAVHLALRASMRSGMVSETITITLDQVRIEHREEGHHRYAVFPRHWARVTLLAPLAALHPSRLMLESHGRACEVGRFLTEEERRGLAARLKQLVGNMNETPAL